MSAQYGKAPGNVVNLVTKPGTNTWHGGGWEYIRNNALDANDFFLNQSEHCSPAASLQPVRPQCWRSDYQGQTVLLPRTAGRPLQDVGTPADLHSGIAGVANCSDPSEDSHHSGLDSTAAFLYDNFMPANVGTSTGHDG